ncbi:hypothetical protein [Burkholderia sp. Bp9142]|uniref:hypothetical protein n=1 Tax=Burkholderia sp. Bp9142 TaxID=2184573 RepID=UPI0021AB342C|nr:hypothetical protein [Burkholderia sp. Bp9142]
MRRAPGEGHMKGTVIVPSGSGRMPRMRDARLPNILTVAWTFLVFMPRNTLCTCHAMPARGTMHERLCASRFPVIHVIHAFHAFTHARFQRKPAVTCTAAEGRSADSPGRGDPRRVRRHLACVDGYPSGARLCAHSRHAGRDELVDASPVPLCWFVVDAGAITDLDYSAARTITDLVQALHARRIGVLFARVLRTERQWRCVNAGLGVLLAASIVPMWLR